MTIQTFAYLCFLFIDSGTILAQEKKNNNFQTVRAIILSKRDAFLRVEKQSSEFRKKKINVRIWILKKTVLTSI